MLCLEFCGWSKLNKIINYGPLPSPVVGDVDLQNVGYYVSLVLWIVAHIVSTTYTFTWDIKMDWGLFEGKYKLRSELIYSRKVWSDLCEYLAIIVCWLVIVN